MMLVFEEVSYIVIFRQFLSSKEGYYKLEIGLKYRYEIPDQGMLNF